MTVDTFFFIASKLIGALLRPDTWIIVAQAVVVLALIARRRRLALWLSTITLTTLLTFAILPIGNLILQPIERSYPVNPNLAAVAGIIVLGGGEDARGTLYWDQVQLGQGGERYTAALMLARKFPEARIS